MAITIKVNGTSNSLVHKGSSGVSAATIPDVCKTPSPGGPVPIPYPNISQSPTLTKGTTTVTADGGMMIAVKGSEFATSNGDNPGVAGGVTSGTFMKESTWILYSFDVKMEGSNACRLTDKKFQNHGNTVDLGGLMQAPVEAWPELMIICKAICECDKKPLASASGESDLKQECVEKALNAADLLLQGKSPIKAEIPYNMTTFPPTPIVSGQFPGLLRPTTFLPGRMKEMALKAARANGGVYQVRIPDAVITRTPGDVSAAALTAPNLKAAVEIKFNKQPRDPRQIRDYQRIVNGSGVEDGSVVELSPEECQCGLPEPERVPALERMRFPVPVAPPPSWLERNMDRIRQTTGLTGAALALYLIVSEGSRILFPPRNLVPVP
jgi:uncharacterized protein DUF4150